MPKGNSKSEERGEREGGWVRAERAGVAVSQTKLCKNQRGNTRQQKAS